MTRILIFLRQNAIAIAALFIALGGTSYAAVAIPRNSVGTKQLRNGAVTASKLASGTGGEIAAVTQVSADGVIVSSTPKAVKVSDWQTNEAGLVSESGIVYYPRPIPRSCQPIAMPVSIANARGQDHLPVVSASRTGRSGIQLDADAPTYINLSILCPRAGQDDVPRITSHARPWSADASRPGRCRCQSGHVGYVKRESRRDRRGVRSRAK